MLPETFAGFISRQEMLQEGVVCASDPSALAVGGALGRRGVAVTLVPVRPDGHLDLEILDKELNDDVLLVSLSLVNSEIGTIQKLDEIARLVRRHGALLHSDAAQAPCAMDTCGIASLCDLVSLGAQDLRAEGDRRPLREAGPSTTV
jgi:cysteine sulfinate desulfinase/cysteine desulfurase-like protein